MIDRHRMVLWTALSVSKIFGKLLAKLSGAPVDQNVDDFNTLSMPIQGYMIRGDVPGVAVVALVPWKNPLPDADKAAFEEVLLIRRSTYDQIEALYSASEHTIRKGGSKGGNANEHA
jgi:hypothetical protein